MTSSIMAEKNQNDWFIAILRRPCGRDNWSFSCILLNFVMHVTNK